jgi:putative membrane protein
MNISALAPFYFWIKAFHVISMVAWMAGLFYLPRLYVYHTQTSIGSESSERFKVMERRLLRGIMNPAMIATWLFGILLALTPGMVNFQQGWFHVKLTFVILMSAFHMACSKWRKGFLNDKNQHSEKFYRMMNEIPTVLLLVIVIMVVVKPF